MLRHDRGQGRRRRVPVRQGIGQLVPRRRCSRAPPGRRWPGLARGAVRRAGPERDASAACRVERPSARAAVARASADRQRGRAASPPRGDDSGSPQYGHYESIAWLARRFGAAARALAGHRLPAQPRAPPTSRSTPPACSSTRRCGVAHAERLFEHRGWALPQRSSRPLHGARHRARGSRRALRGSVTGVVGLDTEPLVRRPSAACAALDTARRRDRRERPRRDSAETTPPSSATTTPDQRRPPSGCPAGAGDRRLHAQPVPDAYNYAPLQAAGIAGQGERVALIEIDGFRYAATSRASRNCFGFGDAAINALRRRRHAAALARRRGDARPRGARRRGARS